MTDREEREEHIKRLEAALACEEKQSSGKCSKQTCDDNCALLYDQGNWGEWKETLRYAINSLKTDLKYDLLYEETSGQADKQADKSTTKNDLVVDWESYKDVDGNSLDDLILEVLQNNFDCGNTYGYKVADEIIGLLPPVTPQLSSGLEKNSKKLEKDFGESDCISREQALRELKESAEHHANDSREEVLLRRDRDIIRALPSVTPQEPKIRVLERDEALGKLGAVDVYQARAWITLLNDLEYLKLKICEVDE